MIDDSKVMIFSRSDCFKSNQAKQTFAKYGIAYSVIELNEAANGNQLAQDLKQFTWQPIAPSQNPAPTDPKALPQIFIGGQYIGTYEDLTRMIEGNILVTLLEREGIQHKLPFDY